MVNSSNLERFRDNSTINCFHVGTSAKRLFLLTFFVGIILPVRVDGQPRPPASPTVSRPTPPNSGVRYQPRQPNQPRPGQPQHSQPRPGQTTPRSPWQSKRDSFDPKQPKPGQRNSNWPLTQKSVPSTYPQVATPYSGPVFRNPIVIRSYETAYNSQTAARTALSVITSQLVADNAVKNMVVPGNLIKTQEAIIANFQHDSSLNSYMAAIDSLGKVNAPTNTIKPYLVKAQRLAFEQVRSGTSNPLPWVATAGFALQDRNEELFRATTHQILEKFPENPQGHYYAGVQAIEDGNWKLAEKSLKHAEELGMAKVNVAELIRLAINRQKWIWQYAIIIALVGIAWAIGLLWIYGLGIWLSRSTLKATERHDPSANSPSEYRLRWIYRRVIDLSGIYYYLSLPILLVISIALPLSLAYAALMLPYLNLWIVGIFLVGGITGIITAISGIRTAFVRIPDEPEGRLLTKDEAEGLWKVLEEVAEKIGTRPVDEVWITPQTDMAVWERGSTFERMQGKGRRALIMGIGLVPDFHVDAMRSILAHEYAHFQHGDTAGGNVALLVRAAMLQHAKAISQRGVIRSWEIAIWYLKFYYRLFNSLTHGASRLQEVLADRRALEIYGSLAFISGLGHVLRRGIEFDLMVDEAVSRSVRSDKQAVAFYAPKKELNESQLVEIGNRLRDIYQLPEFEGDTHPSISQRFATARRYGNSQPLSTQKVVSLFDNFAPLIAKEMARLLADNVKNHAKLTQLQANHSLQQVEQAIEEDPSCELIETRAVLNFQLGDYERALDDLNLLLEVNPSDLQAVLSRSNLLETMEKDQALLKDLSTLRKHASHLPTNLKYQTEIRLGNLLLKHNKLAEAASAFDKAISMAPDSVNAIFGRVLVAEKAGKLTDKKVQGFVSKLLKLCPEDRQLKRIASSINISLNKNQLGVSTTRKLGASGWAAGICLTTTAMVTAGFICALAYWSPRYRPDFDESSVTTVSSESKLYSILDHNLLDIEEKISAMDLLVSETQAKQESVDAPLLASIVENGFTLSNHVPKDKKLRPKPTAPNKLSIPIYEIELDELSNSAVVRKAIRSLIHIGRAMRDHEKSNGMLLRSQQDANLSWRVHLLPHLGQEDLYNEFDLDASWDSPVNKRLINKMPEIYHLECNPGHTRFCVFHGNELLVRHGESTESRFARDGKDNTAVAYMVGFDKQTIWTKPDDFTLSEENPNESLGLEPSDPVLVLFADGNTKAYSNGIHPKKLWAFATAERGEKIERSWFNRGQAKLPPMTVPKRAEGRPDTEVFVHLPPVRSPRRRNNQANDFAENDPVESRLRSIGLGLAQYHNHASKFPVPVHARYRDETGKPYLSWRVHLLPVLDQNVLYKKFNLNEPWDSEHNRQLIDFMPAVYGESNPDGKTRFLGLSGPHQLFEQGGGLSYRNITDGTANTISVVYAGTDKAVPWTQPTDLELDLKKPKKSLGRYGSNIACLLLDGSTMRLPKKTPDDALAALATYNGKEIIDGLTMKRFSKQVTGISLSASRNYEDEEISRLKKINLALSNYENTCRRFPADSMRRGEDNQMERLLSWRIHILPFIGHANLYKQFNLDEPWNSKRNKKLIEYMPDLFRDADDSYGVTETRIQVMTGRGTAFEKVEQQGRGPSRRNFTDGASNTILVLQVDEDSAVPWTQPIDYQADPNDFVRAISRSSETSRWKVGMADGAVVSLPPTTDVRTVEALCTINGNDIVNDSWRYGK